MIKFLHFDRQNDIGNTFMIYYIISFKQYPLLYYYLLYYYDSFELGFLGELIFMSYDFYFFLFLFWDKDGL